MLFKNISIIDEDFSLRRGINLLIKDDRIAYIGEAIPEYEAGIRVINGEGRLLIPAFYNSHTHLAMTYLRGYGENMVLQDWLHKRIFPVEDRLTADACRVSTIMGLAEMARFGTVSASDSYFFPEGIFAAVKDSGMKLSFGRSIAAFDDSDIFASFRMKEQLEAVKDYHGACGGRFKMDFSIHAIYTCTEAAVAQIAKYMQDKKDFTMQIHISETALEVEDAKAKYGLTPVEYFDKHGLIAENTLAAHCVHLTDNDIDIMTKRGATVATCPASNLKLASGIANLGAWKKAGLRFALGTDSVASNNNLNMLEQMKLLAILHKGNEGDPTLLTPAEVLYSATRAGAVAQQRHDCGLLKEGFCADIVMLNVSGVNFQPAHDMLANIIYSACAGDIMMTVCDGRVVYENGEFPTMDMERTFAEFNAHLAELIKD